MQFKRHVCAAFLRKFVPYLGIDTIRQNFLLHFENCRAILHLVNWVGLYYHIWIIFRSISLLFRSCFSEVFAMARSAYNRIYKAAMKQKFWKQRVFAGNQFGKVFLKKVAKKGLQNRILVL